MDEWFVVFRNSDHPHWWNRFLRPGFQHVYCLGQLADDIVLGVNPTLDGLEIGLMQGAAEQMAREAAREGGNVLRVPGALPAYRLPQRFGLMTCATVVAYHLGLPVWAPTPWRLYRRLMRSFDAEAV